MNGLNFWSEWELSYRITFKVLAVLLIVLMGSLLTFHFTEYSYFFEWQITAYMQEVLYPIFSNHSDFLESTVNTEISLLLQKVSGGYSLLPIWLIYTFLILVYLSISGALTIVSYISRFWFIIAMGLFILLLTGAGIGRLGILGLGTEMAVGLMSLLFIGPAYYFNSINIGVSMRFRFLSFIGLMLLAGVIISFGSSLTNPILQLAYFSYWPAIIITVVFILLVGHEVVYAMLSITTQAAGVKSSSNAVHFIVFSSVYLLSLVLLYLKSIRYIDWDMYYLDPILLLSVSTVLGVWGLKGREVLYRNTLPFQPYALLLYCTLAVVCYTSILLFKFSGNDSSLEVIENAIIYGHIAFGGMFFIYIIANFVTLLLKNLPVYKVAFKEDNFPYATSRLAGLIGVAAFFFASNYAPLSQSVSGYFNGLGDMNLTLGRPEVAKTYYTYGATYGNTLGKSNGNHKSNFMLAALETDPEKIVPRVANAVKRKPSEYAYATLGSAYEDDNRFFEALFTYQEGLKKFPKSWALANNLAMLYNKTDVTDSVLFYLEQANDDSWHGTLMRANLVAIATMRNVAINTQMLESGDRIGYQNNLLGYKISKGILEESFDPSVLESTLLHLYSFSFLKNYGIACAYNGDKTFLQVVDQFINEPRNGDYMRDLNFIKGLNLYRQGEITLAFELMQSLESQGQDNGKINALLGKWSMELGSPWLASRYFELSRESGYPWAVADVVQMYVKTDRNSVGMFLLNREIEDLDSTREESKRALISLDSMLQIGRLDWNKKYSFESEKMDLANLRELAKGDSKETIAVDFELLAMRNPFFEEGVLTAVDYFKETKKDSETAYNILQNAIVINEYSVDLIKAYIDQCFSMGLLNYAETTILRLYDILPLSEFQAYEQEFEAKKSAAQANLDNWD